MRNQNFQSLSVSAPPVSAVDTQCREVETLEGSTVTSTVIKSWTERLIGERGNQSVKRHIACGKKRFQVTLERDVEANALLALDVGPWKCYVASQPMALRLDTTVVFGAYKSAIQVELPLSAGGLLGGIWTTIQLKNDQRVQIFAFNRVCVL